VYKESFSINHSVNSKLVSSNQHCLIIPSVAKSAYCQSKLSPIC